MKVNDIRTYCREAAMLAERFPDLSDREVIDFIEEIYPVTIKPDTLARIAIIDAYIHGDVEKAMRRFIV
jgi:hypothetical protein